ncbi:hypothetical protein, partial [Streptomyces rubiginosohelvolus]|uniref:hypothetical protein n=1 Tax=Streptomyces rubiginosohelvolus TaxID=67362 RepID=UPI0036B4C4D6
MNDGGRFHRRHLLAEVRRHPALVLRGRRRDPGLDDQDVSVAISTHSLDISKPKTVRGREAGYRLCTAGWALSDLPARRRTPAVPDPDRRPPADPGEPAGPRPPGQDAGEWEIPRIPLQYDRAVLAGAAVREQLRTTTTATVVRGRAYDVVAHQQAAMPEQLLAPEPADPEHDDHEQKPGRRGALDLTALRALRDSRTDVEALDLTAERLRHLQDVYTEASEARPHPRSSRGPAPHTGRCRRGAPDAPARPAPTTAARTAPGPEGWTRWPPLGGLHRARHPLHWVESTPAGADAAVPQPSTRACGGGGRSYTQRRTPRISEAHPRGGGGGL